MSYTFYLFWHLASAFLLVGLTFYACAAPSAKTRRPVLIASGILSLIVLIGGFGLQAKIPDLGFPGWIWVKLVSWLGISAIAGLAYRRRNLLGVFLALTSFLAVLAVYMVTYKPF
ncbi:MAG: hypothetical protein WD490_00355 [Opitutales bacterium]